MGIAFDKVSENNVISDYTMKLLNHKCICGKDLEFYSSLSSLYCKDKKCKCRVISRIEKCLSSMGVDTSSFDIYNIVNKLDLISPYQIFLLKDAYNNNLVSDTDIVDIKLLEQLDKIVSADYKFYNLLEMSGIDTISNIACKLAYGFNNLDEFYSEVEGGQLVFINERLGIDTSDGCIISLEVYNKLLEIKDELIFAESIFKITPYRNRIFIAFNDNVKPFNNKMELMDYLKYTYKNTFVHVTVIRDNLDILVKKSNNNTNKFRLANLINDKYVADKVNSGELELSDIGKLDEKQLKPIGSRVYIDSLENILSRLEKTMNKN